jgi:hypothetical protein
MSEAEVIAGINKVLSKLSKEKNKKRFKKWNKLIGFTFKDFGETWVTTLIAGVPSELEEREIDKSVKYDIHVSTTPAT